MPEISGINTNALPISPNADRSSRALPPAKKDQEELLNRAEQNEPERSVDASDLEQAFNSLQTARSGENRSGLYEEPQGPAQNATRAYEQTESFLQRDQLTQLVGFDGYA